MPPITINLDSTSLGESACIRSFIQTTVGRLSEPEQGGYREKVLDVKLVYGIAVHAFIDTMYKTRGNYPIAVKKAQSLFETIPFVPDKKKLWMSEKKHLINTCYQVWTEYVEVDPTFEVLALPISGIETQAATEVNFSLPYYTDDTIHVNLCGTIDRVGKYKNGCYAIRDWKTTGSWDTQGYFTQYQLSRQLRFYTLACKLMAERFPDSVLGQIGKTHMGAAIDGIFLNSNANETKCTMSDVYQFSDKQMSDFRRTLDEWIVFLSVHVRDSYLPKQGILNGTCERKFAKCKYWVPCKLDDMQADTILKRDFIRKNYDPLHFNT